MLCSLSAIDETRLSEIKSLESELGVNLLAFHCTDAPIASLDQDQLKEIDRLEQKLGVVLVAVQATA